MTLSHQSAPTLLLWLAVAFVGGCGGGGTGSTRRGEPAPTPPARTQSELDYAQDVLDLVNQERTSRGLDPVVEDLEAAEAAYGHAYDMDVRGFFDHDNPTGEDPGERLQRAGVNSLFGWGENIAQGQPTPEAVMSAWMDSTGHRRNILDPLFGRLGIGVRLSSGGPWWVQDFVQP